MTDKVPTRLDALIGKKTRLVSNPYLVFFDDRSGWTWKVLKRYGDSAKPFARWFLATSSPYVEDELGDGYVDDVVINGQLVEVDGREPTPEERVDADVLRAEFLDRAGF